MTRVPIIILITALITGAVLLLNTCSDTKPLKPDKTITGKVEEQIDLLNRQYKQSFEKMQNHSDSLERLLEKTQKQLIAVKIKLQQSKLDVVKLVEKDTSGLSIEQQLNDCDSLKQEVKGYVVWVDSTQAHYENHLLQLNSLLALKDSQLVICSNSYSLLKSIADANIERERKLTQDLETAYKQQRKKNIQNKTLAVGFMILSGISTTLFIQSRQ